MELDVLIKKLNALVSELQKSLKPSVLTAGKQLFEQGACTALSRSAEEFNYLVDGYEDPVSIHIDWFNLDGSYEMPPSAEQIRNDDKAWQPHSYACLLDMQQSLAIDTNHFIEHKHYTRAGMIQRVLDERRQKATTANYKIKWADNIYGDHILTNENGVKYKIFLRDFENETGYSNSQDSAVNKLGTTKHIMFAYNQLKASQSLYKRLKKTCPFIEVYCDPLNHYAVRYFYPHTIPAEIEPLINTYFRPDTFVAEEQLPRLMDFINEASCFDHIVVRPEVVEKVNQLLEDQSLKAIQQKYVPDFSHINATLYPYQQEGIQFAACRKHAIIADEMGLGKTIQAIGAAVMKKEIFGFTKTLVICPASLKAQWKKEIEKFTNEKAEIVQGFPNERELQYLKSEAYFLIINYETVLRDQLALNKAKIDFLILDEAQKVKNYATKSASAIKNINRKHVLIITGTPIENKLIDLFSLMTLLDPHLLGPLWEFSYKHCLFDHHKPNKINAYYNLTSLKEELKPVLLRREKHKVIQQLPNVQQHDIPVGMTPLQADFHASYASGIGQIINKRFMTAFDLQRLQQLLTAMRMTCDSTYLIDESTNDSPKLEELRYILLEKLDLKNSSRKVIIFSEWVKMHKLIGDMLLKNNIGYSELNGSIPVKKRGDLIKQFESDEKCKVFLSTEAGGAGLNLQVADTLINFELPWNPAKKNQRIGRIDRLGQKSSQLTIFNFITTNSIEERIATGLMVKQNLFDSVLNDGNVGDFVDFTEKGRGQFLQQMKELAGDYEGLLTEIPNEDAEIAPTDMQTHPTEETTHNHPQQYKIPFEEENEDGHWEEETVQADGVGMETSTETIELEPETPQEPSTPAQKPNVVQAEQMEQVLNNGMQFLAGLMQMATGKNIAMEDQKIEVNKETGEVTLKFKLPTFQ
jgi:SNF2 family DNA or RNA helicase